MGPIQLKKWSRPAAYGENIYPLLYIHIHRARKKSMCLAWTFKLFGHSLPTAGRKMRRGRFVTDMAKSIVRRRRAKSGISFSTAAEEAGENNNNNTRGPPRERERWRE
jgi:hypothetical protein